MAAQHQHTLPFSTIRNSELLSNHWLEHRLPLEPEWEEFEGGAFSAFQKIIALWQAERNRVEKYGKEAPLEKAFIQPIFEALGWQLIYQCHLRGRKPDYALFNNGEALDAALAVSDSKIEFWQSPTILADAKAWEVSLDRPTIINQKKEYPPEQIEWYLNQSALDYAILTNGRQWRLVPRHLDAGQGRFETYLQCDLARLLNAQHEISPLPFKQGQLFEDFFRFYLFFSPVAFARPQQRLPLIERARSGSNEYRVGVGEELKPRVFEALTLCIEGFLAHRTNALSHEKDIETVRQQSLILLYRLLFILFAEDRKLLPFRVNPTYTDNRSLGRFREDVAASLERIAAGRDHDYKPAEVTLWPELLKLFDLIDRGYKPYGVPAYNGGLFDPEQHPFLSQKVLPDRWLARVIDQLSRASDPAHPNSGLFRVDYRDLAIQHLGNVYEGLLELRPNYASQEMVVVRNRKSQRKEEKIQAAGAALAEGFEHTGAVYRAGQVYLLTDKGERRASGSYYTPNHIVDYIVEKTLGPLCERIGTALGEQVNCTEEEAKRARGENRAGMFERLAALQGDFDDRVLRLRVVDPAMGSGHFLIRACQYLAEQIATHPYTNEPGAQELRGDEPVLVYWKRKVAESCLYGVDKNPMAVELAKLALWLETVAVDQPLTFLDHHLRHGDSLIGANIEDLGSIVGAGALWSGALEQQVKQQLPVLLRALEQIRRIASDSVEQVKEKERLFHKVLEPQREVFVQTAHVWSANFFLPRDQRVPPEQYKALIETLSQPPTFRAMIKSGPFPAALAAVAPNKVAPFHWQLEFPEVFFGDAGVRADEGFDAVIGNPPYDVLSEKEIGRDLSEVQAFLRAQKIYLPSFTDKNNLYKLFICRALSLLCKNGRLGFITPMALLGDKQAVGVRREILSSATFNAIESFPQKDDHSRRVFREAKLSTAIIIILKTDEAASRDCAFRSRTHSQDTIDIASPSLKLTPASLKQYDPENLTIVSCSQVDWDLVVRVVGSGRMKRLGQYATSFQGEVNETNDRAKGRITYEKGNGQEVLRGAHVCLYCLREASQGTAVFVDPKAFGAGAKADSKATHHKYARAGFQRKSPQNNFRRLIAAIIPAESFLLESVSYVPEHQCLIPLEMVIAILNCKLAEWFFRLGSTNAMVAEYQFNILPAPAFANQSTDDDKKMQQEALQLLASGELEGIPPILAAGLANPPFSLAVQKVIVEAVQRIVAIEENRGEIARTDRSALDTKAQPFQDLIDRLFYRMAGLTDAEAAGLEQRLATML